MSFRSDAEFGIDNLNGIYQIEYSLEAGSPGAISEPSYLEKLGSFTAWLREQPEVTHVYSYSDVIQRLNRNMHGDDPAWHGARREAAAGWVGHRVVGRFARRSACGDPDRAAGVVDR